MLDDRLTELAVGEEAALLRYAYLLTGSRQDAEDLVQGAFAKVLGRPSGHVVSVPAYLRRVILNDFRSLRRRLAAQPRVIAAELPPFEEQVALREAVWRGLQSLPQRQRAVMVLRYYEGLPDEEIAGMLGCRRSTVRSLATRAFAALRDHPDLGSAARTPAATHDEHGR